MLGSPGALLLEVGCGRRADFEQHHVGGAAFLDISALEAGPLVNKAPDHELLAVLLARGIRCDSTVVLYGCSQLAAARAAHLMLYAGVRDVRLLDGGMQTWAACGLPWASAAAAWCVAWMRKFQPEPGRPFEVAPAEPRKS